MASEKSQGRYPQAKTPVSKPFISTQRKRFFTQDVLQLSVTRLAQQWIDMSLNKALIVVIDHLEPRDQCTPQLLNAILLPTF